MNFFELRLGLQLISQHGDVFEICAIGNRDQTALVKLVEHEPYSSYTPVDIAGQEITDSHSGWINGTRYNFYADNRYEVCFEDLKFWRMDVPKFEEGDLVTDRVGNVYKIAHKGEIDGLATYQIELVKHYDMRYGRTANRGAEFEEGGLSLCIYNSQNAAVLNDDYIGIYQLFATELKPFNETLAPQDPLAEGPKELLKMPADRETTNQFINTEIKKRKITRLNITQVREITAKAKNADLDKVLDEIYPKILEAAERGEHTVSFDMLDPEMSELAMFSPKYKIFEYFSDEGYKVLESGGKFEIKW